MWVSICLYYAGIQGVATEEWHTFGANLSTPAYLIPFMKAKDATTFEGVAESIITVVSDCFARQKQFYIVGFSFGAIVALKLAQMLECSGKRGRILLIDGSPIYMKKMFTSMMSPTAQKDRNVEDILIMLLYFNMCSKNTTYDFIDQLPNWDSWPKKMDLLFRYVPDTIKQTYSTQYMRNVCTAMLKRVLAIVKTSTDIGPDAVKLKSLATLVRPTQTPFSDIADDFDLSKYFEKTVDIRFVKGTNAKMLNNDEVIQIVDKFAPAE